MRHVCLGNVRQVPLTTVVLFADAGQDTLAPIVTLSLTMLQVRKTDLSDILCKRCIYMRITFKPSSNFKIDTYLLLS